MTYSNKAREFPTKAAATKVAIEMQSWPSSKKYKYRYKAQKLPSGKWGVLASAPRERDAYVCEML